MHSLNSLSVAFPLQNRRFDLQRITGSQKEAWESIPCILPNVTHASTKKENGLKI